MDEHWDTKAAPSYKTATGRAYMSRGLRRCFTQLVLFRKQAVSIYFMYFVQQLRQSIKNQTNLLGSMWE